MNHPEGSRTRAIGALLNLLEARGIALDGLCDGLEYDLEEIGTAERWLSWNDTVELIDRVVDRVGGRRPFIELARLLPYHPATRPVFGFGRIALGPEPLYRLVAKYVGPNVFPTHRSEFEVLGPNRFRVTLSLPEDVRGCEDFFWAAYGTYVALPRVIGLGDAEVEAKISPHRGELYIIVPPSRSLRSRIGGIFRVLSSTPSVVEELIGQQSEMYERFRELRQAYATLESRAEDLQQEVEQRRRTEELLRQKDRELHQSLKLETVGQLAAGIAHDFNNVLTAVSAYAEMLETELAGSEDGRELVEGITATIDRATELTNKLLAFSRRQHLEPRRLDVNRVIAEQLDVVRRVLSGVEIETSLAPDVSTVILDPVQLQQVVFNLVINARDAMPAGGTLRIRTENAITDGTDPTRVVRISIADTGRGMDAVTLARAYEPFFTTKGPGGTGLGLSTVKAIVAQGGGRIDVASAPGRGTRFRIELPAVEGEPEVVERREWGTPPAAGGGESILLVDDDEALLQILSLSLEAAGYRVYIARSVAEALRVASSLDGALDLVVTDVLLGDGRGPELVARIRRDEPGVRALAISGLAATDAGNGETDLPMLRKPFTPTQLLRRVSRFLAEPATEPRSPDPGAPPSPTSGGTPRPT